MRYSKGKDREIKIRKKQNSNKKKVKRKVISVIKNSICVLIYLMVNYNLHKVSLDILLDDFCTFGIFYIVSSLVKLCQNISYHCWSNIFKGILRAYFLTSIIINVKFVTNFSLYFIPSFGRFVFYWLKSIMGGSNLDKLSLLGYDALVL